MIWRIAAAAILLTLIGVRLASAVDDMLLEHERAIAGWTLAVIVSLVMWAVLIGAAFEVVR